jgi:two-component system chemotaxis response regulator CheY
MSSRAELSNARIMPGHRQGADVRTPSRLKDALSQLGSGRIEGTRHTREDVDLVKCVVFPGCIVYCTLAVFPGECAAVRNSMPPLEPNTMSHRATVLIAEDDPVIGHILELLLSDEGYSVLVVVDGQEALDLALTRQIDLILLDLQMPVLNGAGFCRAYRERGGSAPVLLLTAASDAIVRAAVTACGAAGHIPKPFDVDDVLATVARYAPIPG